MIIQNTTVVGVESNAHHVQLLVRRKGTESYREPEKILIVPQDNGLIVTLHHHFDTRIDREQILSGDMQVNIPFKKI